MRSGALTTRQRNNVLKKSPKKVMKNNGYYIVFVVAISITFGNTKVVEALSILGGNHGAYPSIDDLGQMVDRVEDELIGHDVSDAPDSLVSIREGCYFVYYCILQTCFVNIAYQLTL